METGNINQHSLATAQFFYAIAKLGLNWGRRRSALATRVFAGHWQSSDERS
jgi:hypothetical protein